MNKQERKWTVRLYRKESRFVNRPLMRRISDSAKSPNWQLRKHYDNAFDTTILDDYNFDSSANDFDDLLFDGPDTDFDYSTPDVDMDMLINGHVPNYYHSHEVYEVLDNAGYRDLGWANAGIIIPDYHFHRAYKNESGSTTIMFNLEHKLYYSVDMGD